MQIITRSQINQILPHLDLLPGIEKAFQVYSEGRAVVPPVGEMILDRGEVHIKYGYLKNAEYYVIKIASGFYEKSDSDRLTSKGMMLLFSQQSGQALCALLDEGFLTNLRTAVAGSIAAKYLAPTKVHKIGIVGAGTQARLQLSYLKGIVDCHKAMVWGTSEEEGESFRKDMEEEGFKVEVSDDIGEIQDQCRLIVTTTPSKQPLLEVQYLRKGTHITAVGSDTAEKQELDPLILSRADLVVADSIEQCLERGEIFKAIQAGCIEKKDLLELGQLIAGTVAGRQSEEQITVADLTGVAVQDIAIATEVFEAYLKI